MRPTATSDARRLAADTVDITVELGSASTRVGGYIYDLDFDPDRGRLLFAGLEGRVRFLDLASGRSGILIDPPAPAPIYRLALCATARPWP